jgi:hypothetical protein
MKELRIFDGDTEPLFTLDERQLPNLVEATGRRGQDAETED